MLKTIWRQMTVADKILLFFLLILTIGSLTLVSLFKKTGDRVIITVSEEIIASFSLQKPGVYVLNGAQGKIILQIKDGSARIIRADCPKKECMHMGWIRKSGEILVCLPNKMIIRIGEPGSEEYDALTQ